MHDDEFLSQFLKAPRPEFADALRAKLARQDASEEGKIMSLPISSVPQSQNGSHTHPKPIPSTQPQSQRRGYSVMLVASLVLVIFFGTIIAANLQPRSLPLPGAPAPAASATPLPTALPPTASPQTPTLVDAVIYRAVWSPDGQVLALTSSKGVWIYDANDLTAPLYNIYPGIAVVGQLVFSLDSTRLAFASAQGFKLWDLTKQEKIDVHVPHEGFDSVFALNTDGSILASAHRQGIIYFHNVNTNVTVSSIQALENFQPIGDMRFNEAGTELVFIGTIASMGANTPFYTLEDPTGTWKIVDLPPAMFSPSILAQRFVHSIGYSADGSRLAARLDSLAVIWDTATQTEVNRFDTGVDLDGTRRIGQGMSSGEMLPMERGTADMTFSADGTQIATVDTSLRIWDVATGNVRIVIDADFIGSSTISLKPDWTQLAAVDSTGMVVIIDIATTREIARIGDTKYEALVSTTGPFEYGGHVTSVESERAIQAMQKAGMTWIKIDKHYDALSSDVAKDIAAAHAKGFKVLVSTVGSANGLRQGGNDYISSYASWLGEVAASGADAIEVWNEPNLDRTWPTGLISGASYADMLREAYVAIKAANSNTIVISAAPAPTGAEAAFPGRVQNDYNWLQELVQADGLKYLDCVGIQYNEGIMRPSATSGDPRDSYHTRYFTTMLDTYRGVIDGRKPLCFTEIGYLSPEGLDSPLPDMFAWAADVTVEQQALWLAQAVAMAKESGKVRLMIVWNVDFNSDVLSYPDAGYAIIRPDGSCPACETLGAVR